MSSTIRRLTIRSSIERTMIGRTNHHRYRFCYQITQILHVVPTDEMDGWFMRFMILVTRCVSIVRNVWSLRMKVLATNIDFTILRPFLSPSLPPPPMNIDSVVEELSVLYTSQRIGTVRLANIVARLGKRLP